MDSVCYQTLICEKNELIYQGRQSTFKKRRGGDVLRNRDTAKSVSQW